MATRDLLEIARRNAERAQLVLSNRQKRENRRKLMAADYDHGKGKSVSQLAEDYKVSAETVRSDLVAAGVYTPKARTKITPELVAKITAQLKDGNDVQRVAEECGMSFATVRKIGVEAGVLQAGAPRQRRDDSDFEELEKLDGDLRAVHGAGLQALGAALYAWQRRKAAAASPVTEEVVSEAVAASNGSGEPEPPVPPRGEPEAPWE